MEKILNTAAKAGFAGNYHSKTTIKHCFLKPFFSPSPNLGLTCVLYYPITKNVTTYAFWNQDQNTGINISSGIDFVYHEILSKGDAIGNREVEFPQSVEKDSYVFLYLMPIN